MSDTYFDCASRGIIYFCLVSSIRRRLSNRRENHQKAYIDDCHSTNAVKPTKPDVFVFFANKVKMDVVYALKRQGRTLYGFGC